MHIPNSTLGSISDTNTVKNAWTQSSCSYIASASTNVTFKIIVETDNKDQWNIDDISVLDSSSVELLINGNFESNPSDTDWIINKNTCSATETNFDTTLSHSANHSYFNKCNGESVILSQSFTVTIGHSYSISLWYYYQTYGSGRGANNPVRITGMIE
ncbi:unnamed protein product [Adineta ricciae]|nr:unnamed protein product [Adineta ricciae]